MSEARRRVWNDKVDRAAERQGKAGDKLRSDFAHDVLEVIGNAQEGLELVGPFGERRWQPVPQERRTDDYVRRETRRLTDELGKALGAGPYPR